MIVFPDPLPGEVKVDGDEWRPALVLAMLDETTMLVVARDGRLRPVHRDDIRLMWRWDEELHDWVDLSDDGRPEEE